MSERRFAKKPLLYIHQSTIKTPAAPMQHNYVTPKNKKQSSTSGNQQSNKIRSSLIKRRNYDHFDETVNEVKDENDERDSSKLKKHQSSKKFVDMNINEKINYFLNRSIYSPELKCVIETDERNYRGVITDFQDDHVYIRVGRRVSSTEVPLEQIKNIRLLGF